jgi:endonuclease/exonuclease/phosphatase family metal-dependent hydrolase
MASFVFWNISAKPLHDHIARLATTHEADFVLLAECTCDPTEIEGALNRANPGEFHFTGIRGMKTLVFTRLKKGSVVDKFDDQMGRVTIREVRFDPGPGIILVVVHLPDRRNWSSLGQAIHVTSLVRDICRIEDELGHRRTILVGDLNMNPFDDGVFGAETLNAVSTRDIAGRQERTVQGVICRFFYNPMWCFFSDRTSGPPGTFFHRSPSSTEHYWNILDHVLLRPTLMDNLVDLKILETDGTVPLVDRNRRPDAAEASDHLPLFFRLKL